MICLKYVFIFDRLNWYINLSKERKSIVYAKQILDHFAFTSSGYYEVFIKYTVLYIYKCTVDLFLFFTCIFYPIMTETYNKMFCQQLYNFIKWQSLLINFKYPKQKFKVNAGTQFLLAIYTLRSRISEILQAHNVFVVDILMDSNTGI